MIIFTVRQRFVIVFAAVMAVAGAAQAAARDENGSRIQPYAKNPRYWQYKGSPNLLIGGTALDNLFRIPNLKEHLDLLRSVGGNYARCTMSTHGSGLYPFAKTGNLYDLEQPNEEYWHRFDEALRLAREREIIVQIEVWAEFDTFGNNWNRCPWNPDNNVNYTTSNTTLKSSYAGTPSLKIKHDFFYTVPKLTGDTVVLGYQNKFVNRLLSISLQYDNVLYCMTNEMYEGFSPEWGWYWSGYIKDKVADAGKKVETAEMFWEGDLRAEKHRASSDHPEIYSFFEASQNSAGKIKEGQQIWDNLQLVYQRLANKPRPVNNAKIYGSDAKPGSRARTDRFAAECFWRNMIGGCASSRFHRPPWGLGLGSTAQTHIRSMRLLTTELDIFNCAPDSDSKLLSDRSDNEAYLTCIAGRQYALYFPDGGSVGLCLSAADGAFTVKWLDITRTQWRSSADVQGGGTITLFPPGSGHWVALLSKKANDEKR